MTSTLIPFAHLGHWYVGLPVYLGPVVLIGAWLKWASWREQRAKRSRGEQTSP